MLASARLWQMQRFHTRCATTRALLATNTAHSAPTQAGEAVMPEPSRIAVFGGIYSNYLALNAAIQDARRRGAEQCFCLGDLGAFGPHPDRVFPLLREHRVESIQGNYD